MATKSSIRRGDVFVNVVVVLVVLTVVALAGGYALEWVKFYSGPDKAAIEIDTKKIQDATENAGKQAEQEFEQLQKNTGKAMNSAGQALENSPHDPASPANSSPPTPSQVPVAPSTIPNDVPILK